MTMFKIGLAKLTTEELDARARVYMQHARNARSNARREHWSTAFYATVDELTRREIAKRLEQRKQPGMNKEDWS